jgi:hypothetical protein
MLTLIVSDLLDVQAHDIMSNYLSIMPQGGNFTLIPNSSSLSPLRQPQWSPKRKPHLEQGAGNSNKWPYPFHILSASFQPLVQCFCYPTECPKDTHCQKEIPTNGAHPSQGANNRTNQCRRKNSANIENDNDDDYPAIDTDNGDKDNYPTIENDDQSTKPSTVMEMQTMGNNQLELVMQMK